jgi:hypothetical protein
MSEARWTLQGAPLGRTHVVAGPSITSAEQPDGIGVEVDVVPVSRLGQVRADERQRIVDRLLHAANLLDPDEMSRTALTLEKMAMVLVVEGDVS